MAGGSATLRANSSGQVFGLFHPMMMFDSSLCVCDMGAAGWAVLSLARWWWKTRDWSDCLPA